MPGVPSPNAIRKALINLMEHKDINTESAPVRGDPITPPYSEDIPTHEIANQRLRDARQQAQEVQGEDPLSTPQSIQQRRVGYDKRAAQRELDYMAFDPREEIMVQEGVNIGGLPAREKEMSLERFGKGLREEASQGEDITGSQLSPQMEAMVEDVMTGKRDIREVPRPVAEEVIRRDLELGEQ